MQDLAPFTRHRIFVGDEVLLFNLFGFTDGNNPRALVRFAVGRDFVEVGFGKEAGIGHEPFINPAQLVDAEFRIADEATVAFARLLCHEQARQHVLQLFVAQTHLVDVLRGLAAEQVSFEGMEHKTFRIGLCGVLCAQFVVSVLNQAEQNGQGIVQVCAASGIGDGHQGEIAQPVQAVAGLIFGSAGGHHLELRGGFRIQQEQDAVEEAQSFLCQFLRFGLRQGFEPLIPAPAHNVVGDGFNGFADSFAQIV